MKQSQNVLNLVQFINIKSIKQNKNAYNFNVSRNTGRDYQQRDKIQHVETCFIIDNICQIFVPFFVLIVLVL